MYSLEESGSCSRSWSCLWGDRQMVSLSAEPILVSLPVSPHSLALRANVLVTTSLDQNVVLTIRRELQNTSLLEVLAIVGRVAGNKENN